MSAEAAKDATKFIRQAVNEIRNDAFCCICGDEIPITCECQYRIGVLGNIAHVNCAKKEIKYHANCEDESESSFY